MIEFLNRWQLKNDSSGRVLDCLGYDSDSLFLSSDSYDSNSLKSSTHTLISEFGSSWSLDTSQAEISNVGGKLRLVAKDKDLKNKVSDIGHHFRKHQHIDICLAKNIETESKTGFEKVSFIPKAIPTISIKDIDIRQTYLGREFNAPLFITGMTGGIESGHLINRRLAAAAVKYGIPMGIGSQRMALENPEWESVFKLKDEFSELFLMGNLGFAQLTKCDALDKAIRAYEMIKADALCIHVNVMQELVQNEGDTDFHGFFDQLAIITENLPCPVIVKEVGCGLDLETTSALVNLGIKAFDVSGSGGTSWPYIEELRNQNSDKLSDGLVFRNWGIPTAFALKAATNAHPNIDVTATGGIRSGLDVAKAIALGAKLAGVGLPFFRAAHESSERLEKVIESYIRQLRTVMMATSSRSLGELKRRCVFGSPYQEILENSVTYD